MQKVNLPFFYELGARLNPLAQLNAYGAQKMQVAFAAIGAKSHVEGILSGDPALNVCRAVGNDLLRAIEAVNEWLRSTPPDQLRGTVEIGDTQFQNAINKAKEFETILSAELGVLTAFRVTNKGAYSTVELIEQADLILSESVRAKVPQEALEEIKQAGRCLALDSPTAAGFHMMRALESVLHRYYLAVCKPKSPKKLESWAAYLLELKKVAGEGVDDEESGTPASDPKGDPQVRRAITFLYQVKDTRNDIMHPELVLSPDDAFGLLDVAKAAIISMAERLPKSQVQEK